VEIITGSRTVANFVLKPLRRTIDEALHERWGLKKYDVATPNLRVIPMLMALK
jgi:hypothetical protein